jgi:3-hydroxyisobutyrate dehydrogenase
MRVGFVGLGSMGTPMATGILSSGFPVSAYDVDKERVEELIRKGATPARSPAEAAEGADVLITMLPGPPQIEAAMLGTEGALATMRPGSTWIDMSTSNVTTARRVIDAAGSTHFAMLDAPVTGGVMGAQEGTLQIFVGGEKEVFERHLPVLEAMGDPDRIFHVGGRGAGYTVKLCLNLLFFIHVAAGAEVLTLGTKAGVDLDVLHRLLVGSGASSRFLERDMPSVFEGDYREYFRLALACKDLSLAVELGRENGVPLEVSALVEQIHRRALAQYGDGGQLFAVKLLEDLTQISLRT